MWFWAILMSFVHFILWASQPGLEIPCGHLLILFFQFWTLSPKSAHPMINIQTWSRERQTADAEFSSICPHSDCLASVSPKRGANAFASSIRHFASEWQRNLGMSLEVASSQWNFIWPCFEGFGCENGPSSNLKNWLESNTNHCKHCGIPRLFVYNTVPRTAFASPSHQTQFRPGPISMAHPPIRPGVPNGFYAMMMLQRLLRWLILCHRMKVPAEKLPHTWQRSLRSKLKRFVFFVI